jgi:hypothetical protein
MSTPIFLHDEVPNKLSTGKILSSLSLSLLSLSPNS